MSPSSAPTRRPPREERVAQAFVFLADTLVDDFDLPDFLHDFTAYCTDLLDADGAGVMLADKDGRMRLLASSDETARLLELFEIDGDQGPCLTAFRTGETIEHCHLATADTRWSLFAERAYRDGYRSAHAIPMRLRGQVIGVLNLFSRNPDPLTGPHQKLGRALADVVTIALVQHRIINDHRTLAEQLQTAFATRLDIEQAKGLLAERHRIDAAEAFQRMRRHARRTNRKLSELAADITAGRATLPDPEP
ncbi:ANTAR domain-containing protein [Actinoplanes sp. NPDC051494]|uniref:ANTAR domain-containing protein n=1 Tax=Actinoplanes sp. NPDC051494 TaxID=3363907 RepID=UPI003794F2DF